MYMHISEFFSSFELLFEVFMFKMYGKGHS